MIHSFLKVDKKKIDTKEFELPETSFIRDIEDRVFQSIVVQCISQVEGVGPVAGSFIDHLLGRNAEGGSGIIAEQDEKKQSVRIKAEINVAFGISIPEKVEELQTKIAREITKLTGLHVSQIHIIIKNVVPKIHPVELQKNLSLPQKEPAKNACLKNLPVNGT